MELGQFWQGLPENFKKSVVAMLNFKSRSSLRKCSRSDLQLVDSVPFHSERISMSVHRDSVTLHVHKEEVRYINFNPTENQIIRLEYTEKPGDFPQIRNLDRFAPNDLELVIGDFSRIFSHENSRFGEVVLQYAEGINPERNLILVRKLLRFFETLDVRIRTSSFYISLETTGREMLQILAHLDTKTLEHIRIKVFKLTTVEIQEMLKTDQWKIAKSLFTEEKNEIPVKEYSHCETFWTQVKNLEVDDAWKVIETYISKNPPRHAFFYIYTDQPINLAELLEKYSSPPNNEPISTPWKSHLVLHTQKFPLPSCDHVLIVLILNNVLTGRVCHVEHLPEDCNNYYSDYFPN